MPTSRASVLAFRQRGQHLGTGRPADRLAALRSCTAATVTVG